MKKTILLAMAVMFAVVAFSQERRGGQARRHQMSPESMAMAQTRDLQVALGLDSIQCQAVYLMNYADAMALHDSIKARRERAERGGERIRPTEEERRARAEVMKERRKVRDEQMKKILTAEQYEKYLEYMKKVKRAGRPIDGPRRGGAPRGNGQ